MELSLANKGSWIAITVHGQVDAFNHEILVGRLDTLVRAGKKHIIIDLSLAESLHLITARTLVKYGRLLREKAGCLTVVSEKESILEMLRVFANEGDVRFEKDIRTTEKSL